MNQTVILVHLSRPWDGFHRRHMLLSLAAALPPGVTMVCVDRPITLDVTIWHNPQRFFRHIWRATCHEESPALSVVTVRALLHDDILRHVPWMSRLNAWMISRQLRKLIPDISPGQNRIIQWVYRPEQSWVRFAFPDARLIYECYDEYSVTPDGKPLPKVWAREAELLAIADSTLVTSLALLEKRQKLAKEIRLIPNGLPDFFLDDASPITDPIDRIPQPRIGYVGVIRRPMNMMLLRTVFEQHPEWQLVLVGPVQSDVNLHGVDKLANVHFVGTRAFKLLPAIMRKLDVGLIAQHVNEFTRAMRPLKLAEYLGSGLPVVTTRLPDLAIVEDLVFLSDEDALDFGLAIEKALNVNGAEFARKARAWAKQFTWSMIAKRDVIPAIQRLLDDNASIRGDSMHAQ